jgi:hypothetical protein
MACEEEALWRRYLLQVAVEEGVMPPGFEAADFEAAGLPVPGRKRDGANAVPGFVCDSPDKA